MSKSESVLIALLILSAVVKAAVIRVARIGRKTHPTDSTAHSLNSTFKLPTEADTVVPSYCCCYSCELKIVTQCVFLSVGVMHDLLLKILADI